MRHFASAFVIEIPDKAVQTGFKRKFAGIAIWRSEALILVAFLLFLWEMANDFARGIEDVQRNLGSFAVGCLRVGACRALLWSRALRRIFRFSFFLFGFLLVVRFFQRGFQPVVDHCPGGRIFSGVCAAPEERAAKERVIRGS